MSNMKLDEAQAVISKITAEQLTILENAHSRYMRFIGAEAAEDEQELANDRNHFKDLLITSPKGLPVFDGISAMKFMTAITGLSESVCRAFDEYDFHKTHGVSFEEAVEAGTV
ncbi:hypothetical protein A7M79_19235 [Acinetobacter baumannii]|uniref:hypothetical protein n=1 Tax=Acinetobacter baumannii TaxID=470 RepID=UPI0008DE08BB|nr:hypothetical protein [Acinetobacter baumannii]OIH01737.1 hypothetical protein A7M79_19235 [Acinetobacter baumannii]